MDILITKFKAKQGMFLYNTVSEFPIFITINVQSRTV